MGIPGNANEWDVVTFEGPLPTVEEPYRFADNEDNRNRNRENNRVPFDQARVRSRSCYLLTQGQSYPDLSFPLGRLLKESSFVPFEIIPQNSATYVLESKYTGSIQLFKPTEDTEPLRSEHEYSALRFAKETKENVLHEENLRGITLTTSKIAFRPILPRYNPEGDALTPKRRYILLITKLIG